MLDKLKKMMLGREKEKEVIEKFREHINLIVESSEVFKVGLETEDKEALKEICEIEKLGDGIRREIILNIYGGAFIPALRPNFCRLAEALDDILDEMEDVTILYLLMNQHSKDLMSDFIQIAEINAKMSRYLLDAFKALEKGSRLSEILLKIKISEEEVDSLKARIYEKIKLFSFDSYAEWYFFIKFIEKLVNVSDLIEDAADIIQILNVSLR